MYPKAEQSRKLHISVLQIDATPVAFATESTSAARADAACCGCCPPFSWVSPTSCCSACSRVASPCLPPSRVVGRCVFRPVRGTSYMKKATRADGLNQRRPRDGAIADCLLLYVCLLRRPRVRCATRRPGPLRRGRRRMRARRNPRPCACTSSLPRISPRPS